MVIIQTLSILPCRSAIKKIINIWSGWNSHPCLLIQNIMPTWFSHKYHLPYSFYLYRTEQPYQYFKLIENKNCSDTLGFILFCSLVCRYQYYLQVKKDVIDGRLRSSFEQGIRLAALAVQATLAAQGTVSTSAHSFLSYLFI